MRFILFIITSYVLVLPAAGQGCSDAGACSAGSLGLHGDKQAGTDLLVGYAQSIGLADKESLVFRFAKRTKEVKTVDGLFERMEF